MIERIRRLIPAVEWLPAYKSSNIKWDIIAGVTMAMFVIPTSMAYASLAGLPPETGIYCCVFAGLLYVFFGTSKHLSIGPTSAISIVIATSIGALADGDPGRAVTLASATALIMAGLFFLAYLIRLSSLIDFISDTILLGFKAGAALVIASTQLPKFLGIKDEGHTFFERIAYFLSNLSEARLVVFLFALCALGLLILGNRYFKGKPVSLVIVVISILIMTFTGLEKSGVSVIDEIPGGLPAMKWHLPTEKDMSDVFFLALACFFLSYI